MRKLLHRLSGGRIPLAPPVVGVLRLEGVIAPGRRPGGLNLGALDDTIERLFRFKHMVAVALVINSPGGSPVQSALIHTRLRQRAAEAALPIFAFAEDVAASGGYWLALAGDEVWAEESSILGSIGVVSAGFGFAELIRRLGIERRVYTAGESKSLLDPFRAERPEEVERLHALQADIHRSFKDLVRARRGEKLTETPDMFAGTIYTGRQALALGLIDGIGGVRAVMRERFGARVKLRPVNPPRAESWLRRRFAGRASALDLVAQAVGALEERDLWARFGL